MQQASFAASDIYIRHAKFYYCYFVYMNNICDYLVLYSLFWYVSTMSKTW